MQMRRCHTARRRARTLLLRTYARLQNSREVETLVFNFRRPQQTTTTTTTPTTRAIAVDIAPREQSERAKGHFCGEHFQLQLGAFRRIPEERRDF